VVAFCGLFHVDGFAYTEFSDQLGVEETGVSSGKGTA
jgi:hypothetical protein